MTLTGSQLGRVVEALTEAGIVAGVECLASDMRLRSAADFSPDQMGCRGTRLRVHGSFDR